MNREYLFKYLYKGFDCMETETVIGTQGTQDSQEPGAVSAVKWDEINQFQDNRYVSAPEAYVQVLFDLPIPSSYTTSSSSSSRTASLLHTWIGKAGC